MLEERVERLGSLDGVGFGGESRGVEEEIRGGVHLLQGFFSRLCLEKTKFTSSTKAFQHTGLSTMGEGYIAVSSSYCAAERLNPAMESAEANCGERKGRGRGVRGRASVGARSRGVGRGWTRGANWRVRRGAKGVPRTCAAVMLPHRSLS